MPIEVTSLSDPRWTLSGNGARALARLNQMTTRAIVVRLILVLAAIIGVVGGDALLNSYKYYARIIDGRLAHGYLTSRAGLYATPRTVRVGQGMAPWELVQALRRAGYVDSESSDVWSGSFSRVGDLVEIKPESTNQTAFARSIQVTFSRDRIVKITGDEISLESFTLEPEVLTNDPLIKTGRKETLAYADLPPNLVHAILAIEDRRFFDHPGIDVIGLTRALINNASEERSSQGGSTITQQLVKNTYLSPERTLSRKYAEAMLSLALERRLSKQDIFALYCNEVYLGQRGALGARGVAQAARNYFGKDVKSLTLSEAATIAGMIQGPGRYSPDRHPEATRARRNAVLEAMEHEGWISNEQRATASAEPVAVVPLDKSDGTLAPYFIDYVNRVAENDLDVSSANARLYTTIDLDLQKLAETALQHQVDKLSASYKGPNKPQAALVALDPNTGNVLAMVGGRNYGESQLNRATDAQRQPGSTFKPIVYAAALEDGMSPMQMFSDSPREFVYDRTQVYRPENYGGTYSGQDVTMRTALVKSLNVVTVDIAMRTGLTRIANLAERFGLPRPERYPSLALGTTEVTPLQLAAAYATFVNGGRRVNPTVVASLAEPPAMHSMSDEEQVIKPTTAFMITNMLSAVIERGTARQARDSVKGTAIAGKTGTSRDGWFVGYTPNLVCVVWIGFDDNSQLGLTGASAALPAWTEFMSGAVAKRPELGGRNFACPEGIKFVEVDADSGQLATLSCPNRELIAVTDRTTPNMECLRHGNFRQADHASGEIVVSRSGSRNTRIDNSKEDLVTMDVKNLKTTTVQVDSHGRKTLVNDFRQ